MTSAAISDRRRQLIQEQSALNGIDYIEVVAGIGGAPPTQLRVTFVNALATLLDPTQVEVAGGERIPTVAVTVVDTTDDPDTILVTLAGSGDLSSYVLTLVSGAADGQPPAWVDPVLASACFSFGVDCDAGLPCDIAPTCPPPARHEPRLDYLARDWESLRAVLLDRMSVLQPGWTERNAADVRMALVELLAELGDRASYRQDQIATEAYLGTARRRISVRRHARLVDYAMSDGTNARAWVQIAVPDEVLITAGGSIDVVPAGTRLLTGGPDASPLIAAGSEQEVAVRRAGAIEFQTLSALGVVAGAHSAMSFYTWSGSRPMLPATATSATLAGHLPLLAAGDVLVLAETRDPVGPQRRAEDADPTRRQVVRLTEVVATAGAGPLRDVLTGEAITTISWHPGDALAFPLTIAGERQADGGGTQPYSDGAMALGNVVLADHGERVLPEQLPPVPATGRVAFRLAEGPLSQVPRQLIVERLPDGSGTREVLKPFDPQGSAASAIDAPPAVVLPDIALNDDDGPWNVQRDLISSGSNRDAVVEVDDEELGWVRFATDDTGSLLNGVRPPAGSVIHATYRIGNGRTGNVGADAIRTVLDDGAIAASLRRVLVADDERTRVSNPLPARGGTKHETIDEVRERAPFAFRRQERAVTAEDYEQRAAQFGLPGPARIQRAVATIRWTGSWHVVVVAVDPVGGSDAGAAFLAEVQAYLDRYRMAGHDLQVVGARYAPIEVGLAVRVEPEHRRDLVRAELLAVMSNQRMPNGRLGLFHPDRLTFGANVYLGPILAAAQDITGVALARATRFWRHRLPGTDARATGRIEIGPREIARLDNDPSRPERGRFHLDGLEGGR
jgi:hypothetical protein